MRPSRRRRGGWLLLLLAAAACTAAAARAGESAPGVAIAQLRLEADGDGWLAWADNPLAGPVEVMLQALPGARVAGTPALPARATVPAQASVLVTRLAAPGPLRGALQLRLDSVPGSANAKPQDVEYLFPLPALAARVEQGWGGGFSHDDAENRHAVDFASAIGTRVVAARDGTVMQLEAGFTEAGLDAAADAGRANFVRIVHDDGSMALYAHLQAGGVLVHAGQRVRRGQAIGLSGNTGLSSGPHLHFVVQANRGMRLQSIPFRMFGAAGILRFSEVRDSATRDRRH